VHRPPSTTEVKCVMAQLTAARERRQVLAQMACSGGGSHPRSHELCCTVAAHAQGRASHKSIRAQEGGRQALRRSHRGRPDTKQCNARGSDDDESSSSTRTRNPRPPRSIVPADSRHHKEARHKGFPSTPPSTGTTVSATKSYAWQPHPKLGDHRLEGTKENLKARRGRRRHPVLSRKQIARCGRARSTS